MEVEEVKDPVFVKAVMKDGSVIISLGDIHHICEVFGVSFLSKEFVPLFIEDKLRCKASFISAEEFRTLHKQIEDGEIKGMLL